MFEALSERLAGALKKISGRGVLRPEDVDAGLREVRLALLEADVNFKVVKEFVEKVRGRLGGAEISPGLTAPQTVVKAVSDELVELLGGNAEGLRYKAQPPTVLMLIGLQGSGKTTTAVKLALLARREGHRPLVAALDLRRPAAVDQLRRHRGEAGRPRSLPRRADGFADPRHGRRAVPDREGGEGHRPGEVGRPGASPAVGPAQLRRLPRPDPPAARHGLAGRAARDGAGRRPAEGSARGRQYRAGDEAHGSDHPVHDAPGKGPSPAHRRGAEAEDRAGQRRAAGRYQQAAQSARRDAEDGEAIRRGQPQRQAGRNSAPRTDWIEGGAVGKDQVEADGGEKASLLPSRGCGRALTARRPLYRAPRVLRPDDRARAGQDRCGPSDEVAAAGRAAQ